MREKMSKLLFYALILDLKCFKGLKIKTIINQYSQKLI